MEKYSFRKIYYVVACLVLIGLWSCKKNDSYPIEPHLEYLGFTQVGDSALLRFSFTDGDGDIGLSQSDTLPPFQKNGPHSKNLKIIYQYLADSAKNIYEIFYIPGTINDTLNNSIIIDRIKKVGTDKALNGEIQVWLSYPFAFHKYYRFQCQLEDRALHKSNILLTPTFILK